MGALTSVPKTADKSDKNAPDGRRAEKPDHRIDEIRTPTKIRKQAETGTMSDRSENFCIDACSPEITGELQANRGQFKPGQSGNPKGRPKGARNAFSQSVLSSIAKHWETHGTAALDRLAQEEPASYLRLIAGLIPRERLAEWDNEPVDLASLSAEELEALYHHERSAQSFRGLMSSVGYGKLAGS